jgi:hypothetical protein
LGIKPVVTFINPSLYSTDETGETYNVNATVFNITKSSQVNVTVNGNSLTQFTYNATTKEVNFLMNLQMGYNTVTIAGTNAVGSDSKSAIINHKPTGRPPKVTITNPASSPFTTLQNNVIVSGYVYNVISSANITVTANGAPATFNYNINTHEINVPVYLAVINTLVNISASNAFGNDAQSMTFILKRVVADSGTSATTTATTYTHTTVTGSGLGGSHYTPQIAVSSPNVDPFYTNTGFISVSANIDYVTNPNLVNVSYNGIQVSATFDVGSKHLNFSSPLKPGLNTFVITASNQDGTVNKSVNINYTPINVNTNQGGNNNSTEPTYNHGGWNMGGILNGGGNNNSNNNGGNQNPPPRKVNQDGGQVNPVKPINNTPINTPRTFKNDGGGIKPVGGGEQQIKPRPR